MVPVLHQPRRATCGDRRRGAAAGRGGRTGRATREELTGSTITVTSLGALGGIVTTPVINWPEVAIVGVGRIVEAAVFVDGRVEARS